MPHRQGQLATNRTREKSNGDRKISDYVPDGLCRKRGIVLAVAGAMADAAMIQTAQVQDLPPLAGPSGREPQAAWSALDGIDDLGVQYANVYGRINPARNHLRLMAAVLNDAIRVLSKHRSPRRRREEFAWLTSRDRTRVFAFENVCEALGIDADRVRRYVIAQAGPVLPLPQPSAGTRGGIRSSEFGTLRRAG